MKTNFNSLNSLPRACNSSFSTILKSVFTVVVLFLCINAKAQNQPSSNIYGPLKALTTDTSMVITAEVAGDPSPNITVAIENNSTGAAIVSKGAFQYDASSGKGTQLITLNPGGVKGSFVVSLLVSTSGGTCESSKSVTVVNVP